MKRLTSLVFCLAFIQGFSQTTADFFQNSNTAIYYLGIDFSHVKLVGEFSQAYGYGEQSYREIRDDYFPAWNKVVINEREKYDIAGMLRRERVLYSPEMVMLKNKETDISTLEAYNEPNYTAEQVKQFVTEYTITPTEGIGIIFLAECLNKASTEAIFHFIAIDMQSGEILFQKKLYGTPKGFGVRNYWAGSVYNIIQKIENQEYLNWKKEFVQ